MKKIPRIHKTSHWLAVGLGSGLSPIAPGTTGTLGALLLCLLAQNHPYIIGIMLIFTLVAGPHICEIASKDFALQDKSNSHDHRNIVIDEWAGYFISVIFLPFTISNVLLAFILFRVIDITKPWPISWIDKKMNNGYGIMLDDVVAGFFTFLILYSANLLFPL